MHKNRLEAGLKQSLIDQGFTADEIAKIVEATADRRSECPSTRVWPYGPTRKE